jgi:hypothetical protein
VVERASGQKVGETEACRSVVHMLSLPVHKTCSMQPFCGDVYGQVRRKTMM